MRTPRVPLWLCRRGLLLPAVLTELKREEHGMQWRRVASKGRDDDGGEMPKPLLRVFEIARADVTQLSAIDQLSQTFHARLFLILRVPGGALDEHLVSAPRGSSPGRAAHPVSLPMPMRRAQPAAWAQRARCSSPAGRACLIRAGQGVRGLPH